MYGENCQGTKTLWGEVVRTTGYLINKSPSIPLAFDIPEKVLTGEVSNSHLKVFGCKAFAHVPKEQRAKLDDKAMPCIFLGYGDESWAIDYGTQSIKVDQKQRCSLLLFHENETIKEIQKNGEPTLFEMKDLGDASQILGKQIVRDRKSKKLWSSQ